MKQFGHPTRIHLVIILKKGKSHLSIVLIILIEWAKRPIRWNGFWPNAVWPNVVRPNTDRASSSIHLKIPPGIPLEIFPLRFLHGILQIFSGIPSTIPSLIEKLIRIPSGLFHVLLLLWSQGSLREFLLISFRETQIFFTRCLWFPQGFFLGLFLDLLWRFLPVLFLGFLPKFLKGCLLGSLHWFLSGFLQELLQTSFQIFLQVL